MLHLLQILLEIFQGNFISFGGENSQNSKYTVITIGCTISDLSQPFYLRSRHAKKIKKTIENSVLPRKIDEPF